MTLHKFTSFEDILQVKVDDVTPPPMLPAGSYMGTVKQWKQSKSRKTEKVTEEFPVVQLIIMPTTPGKDVNPEDFKEYTDLGGNLADENITYERMVTPRSFHSVIQFIRSATGASAESFEDLLGAATGADVAFVIKHETAKKTGNAYATIDSFYPYGTNIND